MTRNEKGFCQKNDTFGGIFDDWNGSAAAYSADKRDR